jgi:hypothetical protein
MKAVRSSKFPSEYTPLYFGRQRSSNSPKERCLKSTPSSSSGTTQIIVANWYGRVYTVIDKGLAHGIREPAAIGIFSFVTEFRPSLQHNLATTGAISWPLQFRVKLKKKSRILLRRRRDSAVGIATDYGMGGPDSVPDRARFVSYPQHPDRLWAPSILLFHDFLLLLARGEPTGAWSWPLTSNLVPSSRTVELYFNSPMRLYGIMLN